MRSDTRTILSQGRKLAFLVLACWLVRGGAGLAADRTENPPGEYQVKAAFVYNFIKFVDWPSAAGTPEDRIRLCLFGDMPDRAPFEALDGKEIMGKRLTIVRLDDPRKAESCKVLFLSGDAASRLEEALGQVRPLPVLTVGDTDGYGLRGVMINMYLDRKRIRFEINDGAAQAAGLRISARLLSLAGKVYGTPGTGR